MKLKQIIVFDKTESVLSSIIKDFFTFGCLTFCIWISCGSVIWSMIVGFMFISFLISINYKIFKIKSNTFYSLEELQTWIDNQK